MWDRLKSCFGRFCIKVSMAGIFRWRQSNVTGKVTGTCRWEGICQMDMINISQSHTSDIPHCIRHMSSSSLDSTQVGMCHYTCYWSHYWHWPYSKSTLTCMSYSSLPRDMWNILDRRVYNFLNPKSNWLGIGWYIYCWKEWFDCCIVCRLFNSGIEGNCLGMQCKFDRKMTWRSQWGRLAGTFLRLRSKVPCIVCKLWRRYRSDSLKVGREGRLCWLRSRTDRLKVGR